MRSDLKVPPLVKSIKDNGRKMVVVTTHRRESFGSPLEQIFFALKTLAERNPNLSIVFPIHPNPAVKKLAAKMISGIQNILIFEPLNYPDCLNLISHSDLIMTDSGGLQEEAPALGKYTLVLRETTERPEAIEAGMVELVGSDSNKIIEQTEAALNKLSEFGTKQFPFGTGDSGEKIAAILSNYLGKS